MTPVIESKSFQNLPMQTQSVQEGRQTFHHNQDGQGEQTPGTENEVQNNGTGIRGLFQTHGQDHVPQDFR